MTRHFVDVQSLHKSLVSQGGDERFAVHRFREISIGQRQDFQQEIAIETFSVLLNVVNQRVRLIEYFE